MSCYKKGDVVFDTDLRRVVRIKHIWNYDHTLYDVESRATKDDGSHGGEATCCDLRSLDEKTKVGRHNRKVVDQIEKLIGQLR
jgi:hypothetical protein